jgi:hypothetical protein
MPPAGPAIESSQARRENSLNRMARLPARSRGNCVGLQVEPALRHPTAAVWASCRSAISGTGQEQQFANGGLADYLLRLQANTII